MVLKRVSRSNQSMQVIIEQAYSMLLHCETFNETLKRIMEENREEVIRRLLYKMGNNATVIKDLLGKAKDVEQLAKVLVLDLIITTIKELREEQYVLLSNHDKQIVNNTHEEEETVQEYEVN
jgi:putative NIF3 family GTP cyclohydrolase 1 type 2